MRVDLTRPPARVDWVTEHPRGARHDLWGPLPSRRRSSAATSWACSSSTSARATCSGAPTRSGVSTPGRLLARALLNHENLQTELPAPADDLRSSIANALRRLDLETWASMETAVQLYESFGWVLGSDPPPGSGADRSYWLELGAPNSPLQQTGCAGR